MRKELKVRPINHSVVALDTLLVKVHIKAFNTLAQALVHFQEHRLYGPGIFSKNKQKEQTLLASDEERVPACVVKRVLRRLDNLVEPLLHKLSGSRDVGLDFSTKTDQELGALVANEHVRVVAVADHCLGEGAHVLLVVLRDRLLKHLRQLG